MPSLHFSYELRDSQSDLQQGDLIEKSGDFAGVIREVHPHYHYSEDYQFFLILTQSCDLVRRKQGDDQLCKSRYITLAAVRPLATVLEREIELLQDKFERRGGILSDKKRPQIERFVERLLNNNKSDYFFLAEEASAKILEPYCAFLKLSISIRSREHYERCIENRLIGLRSPFQEKLRWLTGNLYSRVGTPDWCPDHITETEFRTKVRRIVNQPVAWVPDEKVRQARSLLAEATNLPAAELRQAVESSVVKPKKERVLEIVETVISEYSASSERIDVKKIVNRMRNNPKLSALLKA